MDNYTKTELIGGPADGKIVKIKLTDTVFKFKTENGRVHHYSKRIDSGKFEYIRKCYK